MSGRRWRSRLSRARYARRRSELGRMFERELAKLLLRMKEVGELFDCVYNKPNSPADGEGKDFTVWKIIDGETQERSFGVTISKKCWHRAQIKHPDVPQFFLPLGTNHEFIKRIVKELFEPKARLTTG